MVTCDSKVMLVCVCVCGGGRLFTLDVRRGEEAKRLGGVSRAHALE